MKIPLTDIINVEKIAAIEDFKLHAARENRTGDSPLDAYVESEEEWEKWNRWRGENDDFNRKYIFSLIGFRHKTYRELHTWLFGGIYEVIGGGQEKHAYSYEVRRLEDYSHYIGRLKIEWVPPPRGRAFYLKKPLEEMSVVELLRKPYSGETFPGYENINHRFKVLKPIFDHNRPGWRSALENVQGVYLITDTSCGKRYVGAAHSGNGIWSRWKDYMDTGHGGNKRLREAGVDVDYARENFIFSLLEYRPMKTDKDNVLEREAYWREVLLTNDYQYGYNADPKGDPNGNDATADKPTDAPE